MMDTNVTSLVQLFQMQTYLFQKVYGMGFWVVWLGLQVNDSISSSLTLALLIAFNIIPRRSAELLTETTVEIGTVIKAYLIHALA